MVMEYVNLNLQNCNNKEIFLILETLAKICKWFPDQFYIPISNSKIDDEYDYEIEWNKKDKRLSLFIDEDKIEYLKAWEDENKQLQMEDYKEITDEVLKELFEWLWTT